MVVKRPVRSHRPVVAIPRDATTCDHFDLESLVLCTICEGRGALVNAEMRRHYKAEPIPWNHPARQQTWVVGT